MNKNQKKDLAKKLGSKTGKLKKKHIARTKLEVRTHLGTEVNNDKLTTEELSVVGVHND